MIVVGLEKDLVVEINHTFEKVHLEVNLSNGSPKNQRLRASLWEKKGNNRVLILNSGGDNVDKTFKDISQAKAHYDQKMDSFYDKGYNLKVSGGKLVNM